MVLTDLYRRYTIWIRREAGEPWTQFIGQDGLRCWLYSNVARRVRMLERRVVEVEIREATVADFHQMQLPRFSPVPRKRTALEELQLTTRTARLCGRI